MPVSIQKYHKKYIDLLVDYDEVLNQNNNLKLLNEKLGLKIKKYDEILSHEITQQELES